MKKKLIYAIAIAGMIITGCTKLDFDNVNAPTDEEVKNTREGLISLAIGVKQYYSTSGLQTLLLTPGTTAREVKGITTFTNIIELEAGGTALPTFNGNVLGIWSNMLRTMSMAEDLIANAPTVVASDNATQTGLVAFGKLFKAMSIGGLATAFEQFPIQTDEAGNASFVTRDVALQEAVKLLDEAATAIGATPPSAE